MRIRFVIGKECLNLITKVPGSLLITAEVISSTGAVTFKKRF